MATQAQDQLHQQELREFFQSKSLVLAALQAEYQVCLDNALKNLINGSKDTRDQNVGYYKAILDVMAIEDKYKNDGLIASTNQ